jgi:uroporphyrinogen-III synthase
MASLEGQRIVITRSREQASELAVLLAARGAEVVELPLIAQVPVEDRSLVDQAAARLHEYNWLLFTSANAVRFFCDSPAFTAPPGLRIAAIGPATARAAESRGLQVSLIPESYVAESVVSAFEKEDLTGRRILLPRAAVARDVVPDALRARGAAVDVVDVYRTVLPPETADRARAIFTRSSRPHWITFTSSSTVKNLLAVAPREWLAGIRLASIGPITSATLRKQGLVPDAEAQRSTMEDLVDAIAAWHD